MSAPISVDSPTVAALRREPMIARAMDLVLQEAERAGDEEVVLRDSTAKVSEVARWVLCRYAAAAEQETVDFAYLAALYRLFALLGEDVSSLWVWHEEEHVLSEVRASLRGACAPAPAGDSKVHASGFPGVGPATLCGEEGTTPRVCGAVTCPACLDLLESGTSLTARVLEIHYPEIGGLRAALEAAIRVDGYFSHGFTAWIYHDGMPIARIGRLREERGDAERDARAVLSALLLVVGEILAGVQGAKAEAEPASSPPGDGGEA